VATVVTHPHRTIQNMLAWLYARPALRSYIHAIEVREAGCSCMNDSGFWLYVSLNGRNPQANTDVEAFMEGKRDGFHGTSLQCLHRIVATGLTIGMAVNAPRGRAIQAIFSWGTENAWKITGYSHYAAIDDSGWVWAPSIYITLPVRDGLGRKSQIHDQQLSYPETTRLHGILLHAFPIASMMEGDGDGPWPYQITAQAKYTAADELSPQDSWDDIARGSQPH
jgi:hypothetical protein